VSDPVTYLQGIVIGLVQGVSELFPVSSLGHAVLIPAFIGGSWARTMSLTTPNSPYLALIVALHVATALALVVFFRRDWVRLAKGLISSVRNKRIRTPYERLAWLLIAGTVPVGLAGIVLSKVLQQDLGKPEWAGVFLTINGLILLMAERMRSTGAAGGGNEDGDRDEDGGERSARSRRATTSASHSGGSRSRQATATAPVPELDRHGRELPAQIASDVRLSRIEMRPAMLIGAAQILGLFPGFSRSGATIVAGVLRGLRHEDAARFAFLLATPVILAAGVYKLPELAEPANSGVVGPAIAGSIVAFIAAYISVRFLTRYFETKTLTPFAIYCLVVGVGSTLYFA
jgi:undecaprenyl-diphosphatase